MAMKTYYRVNQRDPQPRTVEDLNQLIEDGRSLEVDADFNPFWGGGVYVLEDDVVTLHKEDWDTTG